MKERRRNKVVFGITGSFGTGKTTVAGIFKALDAEVVDADKIAHAIIRPPGEIYRKLINIFGEGIVGKNKNINRNELARVVFENRDSLKKLNRIMHPEIIRIMKSQIRRSAKDLIVLDAPLLIESGLHKAVDKIIVVKADRQIQLERIRKKNALSKAGILKRVRMQIPLERKAAFADFIIDNNAGIKETKKQVMGILRQLYPQHLLKLKKRGLEWKN